MPVRARRRPPARDGPTIYEAAGHPQGVALLYTMHSCRWGRGRGEEGYPGQATRSRPPARGGPTIYGRLVPLGEGAWRGGLPRAGHPQQATRKGWPYYIRAARAAGGGGVERRATPGRPPAAGHPQGVALLYTGGSCRWGRGRGEEGYPGQATRSRPPARGGPTIYGRLVPLGEGAYIVGPPLADHPQGVALLYTGGSCHWGRGRI